MTLRNEAQVAAVLSKAKVGVLSRCLDKAKCARTPEEEAAWREVAAILPDFFAEAGSEAMRDDAPPESFRGRLRTKGAT